MAEAPAIAAVEVAGEVAVEAVGPVIAEHVAEVVIAGTLFHAEEVVVAGAAGATYSRAHQECSSLGSPHRRLLRMSPMPRTSRWLS